MQDSNGKNDPYGSYFYDVKLPPDLRESRGQLQRPISPQIVHPSIHPASPKITQRKDARIRVLAGGTLPGRIRGRGNGKRGYRFSRRRDRKGGGVGHWADGIL